MKGAFEKKKRIPYENRDQVFESFFRSFALIDLRVAKQSLMLNTEDVTPLENIICETDRLILRRISPLNDADCDFIVRLINTPEWIQHICAMPDVSDREGGRRYIISRHMKLYKECGFGGFLMVRKCDGERIGMCGLFRRPELEPDADLGFSMLTEHMRQGFTQEAAQGVMKWGKLCMGLRRLKAVTSMTNEPSRRLLERLGFAKEEVEPMWWGHPQAVYSIDLI